MEFQDALNEFTKDFAVIFYTNFAKYVLPAIIFVLLILFGKKLVKYIWYSIKDRIQGGVSKGSSQSQKNYPLTCPRCGSKLVLRTAKRGDRTGKQFYGCSKYPQCKYTRDV